MTLNLSRRPFLSSLLAIAALPLHAAPQRYELHADRSTIAFRFVLNGAPQTGTVPVATADLVIDPDNLAASTADVTADIRKAKTGLIFATQALKSPSILDAQAHPFVRFRSTRIRLGRAGRISGGATIDGQLTLRGTTRPLRLDAILGRPAGSAPDDLSVLFIRLEGNLSRAAFGASGYADMVDDTVGLDIQAEIRARR